jgi:hypothetical protein
MTCSRRNFIPNNGKRGQHEELLFRWNVAVRTATRWIRGEAMASKKYLNKACVYCGHEGISSTADHVIARQFFLPADRDRQPKVPACANCNNLKSQLEHYVLSVLPMGGVQAGAVEALETQLGPRLANNDALRRSLFAGMKIRFLMSSDGVWSEGMSVPFDSAKLNDLSCYIALGLAWHHWQAPLAPSAVARASAFTSQGVRHFEDMWNRIDFGDSISGDLGNGVFRYRGLRSRVNQRATFWQMWFFGGAEFGRYTATRRKREMPVRSDKRRPGMGCKAGDVVVNCIGESGCNPAASHTEKPAGAGGEEIYGYRGYARSCAKTRRELALCCVGVPGGFAHNVQRCHGAKREVASVHRCP